MGARSQRLGRPKRPRSQVGQALEVGAISGGWAGQHNFSGGNLATLPVAETAIDMSTAPATGEPGQAER